MQFANSFKEINKPKLKRSMVQMIQSHFHETLNDLPWTKFYLASSYFLRGLPPKYRCRCCVSQPSSRWIGVGPQRHGHQDSLCPQVNPENCIGDCFNGIAAHSSSEKNASTQAPNDGQALGLLVLLRFTHYCAST